jgi:hypothetical protein
MVQVMGLEPVCLGRCRPLKPVNLHPLDFEEAVINLWQVKDLRGKLGRNDGETDD